MTQRILLAFCLLLSGYLLGSIEKPSNAETLYGYDSNGGSWSSHQVQPGGPTYYYGNDGTSGMYSTTPKVPNLYDRNPC